MKFNYYICFVITSAIAYVDSKKEHLYDNDSDYSLDCRPSFEDNISLQWNERQKKFSHNNIPHTLTESPLRNNNGNDCALAEGESTECTTTAPAPAASPAPAPAAPPQPENAAQPSAASDDAEVKAKELRDLVQHLYIAQARVQLEATEIKKAQAVANSAQQALEEAANHVRTITAALQNAQQGVASAAIRAQTAQLQLAAHDQLLFAARQDVDALSSQMVGLQAAEGISAPKITVDLTGLLEKLRQPLADIDRPTPVPSIVPMPTATPKAKIAAQQQQISNTHQIQLQQQAQSQQPPPQTQPQSLLHATPTINEVPFLS